MRATSPCAGAAGADGAVSGVFSLKARSGEVSVDAPDGEYEELISGGAVSVAGGKLACTGTPVIIRVE